MLKTHFTNLTCVSGNAEIFRDFHIMLIYHSAYETITAYRIRNNEIEIYYENSENSWFGDDIPTTTYGLNDFERIVKSKPLRSNKDKECWSFS